MLNIASWSLMVLSYELTIMIFGDSSSIMWKIISNDWVVEL